MKNMNKASCSLRRKSFFMISTICIFLLSGCKSNVLEKYSSGKYTQENITSHEVDVRFFNNSFYSLPNSLNNKCNRTYLKISNKNEIISLMNCIDKIWNDSSLLKSEFPTLFRPIVNGYAGGPPSGYTRLCVIDDRDNLYEIFQNEKDEKNFILNLNYNKSENSFKHVHKIIGNDNFRELYEILNIICSDKINDVKFYDLDYKNIGRLILQSPYIE